MKPTKVTICFSLIIATIALSILIGFGTWSVLYSPPAPTQSACTDELDTRCWQTYRNEEYEYEIKYPNTWNAYDKIIYNVSLQPIANTQPPCFIGIRVLDSGINNLTIEEWMNKKGWVVGDGRVVVDKISSITLSEMINEDYNSFVLLHLIHDNTVFEIEWSDNDRKNEKAYITFWKILSTFNFIK